MMVWNAFGSSGSPLVAITALPPSVVPPAADPSVYNVVVALTSQVVHSSVENYVFCIALIVDSWEGGDYSDILGIDPWW